jgi:hypothetical protein
MPCTQLPAANRSILVRIVRFLVLFMRNEAMTKMGAKNLGVVFGPVLVRALCDACDVYHVVMTMCTC